MTEVLGAASDGRGAAILVTGEAGIGKTRMLAEARQIAGVDGLLPLNGRAVDSGGAFRPLVDAFARPSAPFARDSRLKPVRTTLARILPGWVGEPEVVAPMADPAAVLAEALILLVRVMAADGALLCLDDLHWADEDTLSVLAYLADSVADLPLVLLLASRDESRLPHRLERLSMSSTVLHLTLGRLTPADVAEALRAPGLPKLALDTIDALVTAVDGLPLVLDEFVRQLHERSPETDMVDLRHTTMTSAVRSRLGRLSPEPRIVLDALSVLGETDAAVLAAVTGFDEPRLGAAIHDGVTSTLLVAATTPLGVTWRHRLMRDAVRDLLLPLEQQAIARRGADHLVNAARDPSDGDLRQAAALYELAGCTEQAARQLVRAARAAVAHAALEVAERYLADAYALTGTVPDAALAVLVERIETMSLAGRAGDAYHSGAAALRSLTGRDRRPLMVATARAAYGAGLHDQAAQLVTRLEIAGEAGDADLAVLRAHAALADRRIDAIDLAEHAAAMATDQGRFDIACEALEILALTARRHDTARANAPFNGRWQ